MALGKGFRKWREKLTGVSITSSQLRDIETNLESSLKISQNDWFIGQMADDYKFDLRGNRVPFSRNLRAHLDSLSIAELLAQEHAYGDRPAWRNAYYSKLAQKRSRPLRPFPSASLRPIGKKIKRRATQAYNRKARQRHRPSFKVNKGVKRKRDPTALGPSKGYKATGGNKRFGQWKYGALAFGAPNALTGFQWEPATVGGERGFRQREVHGGGLRGPDTLDIKIKAGQHFYYG